MGYLNSLLTKSRFMVRRGSPCPIKILKNKGYPACPPLEGACPAHGVPLRGGRRVNLICQQTVKLTFLVFFPFFSIFALQVFAASSLTTLKGHAVFSWKHGGKSHVFDQAVSIESDGGAIFQAIDDFGQTLFTVGFDSKNTYLMPAGEPDNAVETSFKKISSLSLSGSEFVSLLLYRLPLDEKFKPFSDESGRLVRVEKKGPKKVVISFLDFKNVDGITYPHTIRMVSGKTILTFSWKKLNFHAAK